jgi:hypothetical protein
MKTVANKNYMSIGVSVRATKSTARNNSGAFRQESNPQSQSLCINVKIRNYEET